MAGRLDNKVCVITGASSGQGRAGAEAFAREGALLVLSDVDTEGLEETAGRCRKLGVDPVLHVGDLTGETANQELMDLAVGRHGRLDAIYNVAGLVKFSPIHETTLEDWNFTIEHELTITFLGCKWAVRAMLQSGGGSVINVSSVSGMYGARRNAAHAATKAGISGITRHIAHEYGPHGIRCNAIAPSYVEFGPGERRIASQTPVAPPTGPLGRHVRPRDTADLAAFLASDESSFISGQVIVVDGATKA
jgi:NAD(P)-dependent dehydrogenase (short-subunit alcohol dehydrogenase family)